MYHGDIDIDGCCPVFDNDGNVIAVMPSMRAAKIVVAKSRLAEAVRVAPDRHIEAEIDEKLVKSLGGRLV
jgi:hypothetical protein